MTRLNRYSAGNHGSAYSIQQSVRCLEQALQHYNSALGKTARAQEYLSLNRGLDWRWLMERFDVGFGDRTLGKMFPDTSLHENTTIRGALRRAGFMSNNGREVFRGCITFPVKNSLGEVLNVYGRKISTYLRRTSQAHVVMKPVEAEFYNQQALDIHKNIVLCSTPLEAVTLLQLGAENIVSLCGMAQLTQLQIEHFERQNIRTVEVAFANTCRGNRFASKVVCQLDSAGIRFKRTTMPFGEDINSLHVKARELDVMFNSIH